MELVKKAIRELKNTENFNISLKYYESFALKNILREFSDRKIITRGNDRKFCKLLNLNYNVLKNVEDKIEKHFKKSSEQIIKDYHI